MQITYLALCTTNEPFISHQRSQENTWANSDVQVYWLIGDERLSNDYELVGRYLRIKVVEDFKSILEKTIKSFQWAISETQSDFYVRTNTSTYINDGKLQKYLSEIEPGINFAAALRGYTSEILDDLGNPHTFLAGNMMIFSTETIKLLSRMDFSKFIGVPDDVAISIYLKSNEVELNWIDRNDITDYRGFRPNIQHRVKSWSSAQVTVERMYEVHEIYANYGYLRLKAMILLSIREIKRYNLEFRMNNMLNIGRNLNNAFRILRSFVFSLPLIIKIK